MRRQHVEVFLCKKKIVSKCVLQIAASSLFLSLPLSLSLSSSSCGLLSCYLTGNVFAVLILVRSLCLKALLQSASNRLERLNTDPLLSD
jgi:hypothetical protein